MAKHIENIWDLQIVSTKVTKHRVGEKSTFKQLQSKEWWFRAEVTFNTGSVIELCLTEARKEFEIIDTISPNYSDKDKARELAFEDYKKAFEIMSRPDFLYSRAKNGYCSFYGKDESSPTGVLRIGGCTSFQLADYIADILGKPSSLSPTEDMRSAR